MSSKPSDTSSAEPESPPPLIEDQPRPSTNPTRNPDNENLNDDDYDNDPNESEEEEEDEEDDEDNNEEEDNIKCLFCTELFNKSTIFTHLNEKHEFNFINTCSSLHLNFYGAIKMVNFIRTKKNLNVPNKDIINNYLTNNKENTDNNNLSWINEDKYLQPALEEDSFLFNIPLPDNDNDYYTNTTTSNIVIKNTCDQCLNNELEKNKLKDENKNLLNEIEELKINLFTAKQLLNRFTQSSNNQPTINEDNNINTNNNENNNNNNNPDTKSRGRVNIPSIDNGYFSGYSERAIHEEMLRDFSRTNSYRSMLINNNSYNNNNISVVKDKIVLDVGTGTGILAMFAVQGGANKVYAVDASQMADKAKQIIEKNGMSNKITVFKGMMEDVILPSKVDIIVSEWMGYFLLFESMLPSVIFARDKWLNEGGCVYPDVAKMFICGCEASERRKHKIDYWKNVYSFDMSDLTTLEDIHPGAINQVLDPKTIITDSVILKQFNINTVTVPELDFVSDIKLTATRPDNLEAIAVWFDTDFDTNIKPAIVLTTSPSAPVTHWVQTVFYLINPISLKAGESVFVSMKARRNKERPRHYDVDITYWKEGQENNKFIQGFAID